ncbi:alpha/beta hydrolase [Sinorhizobium sp. BG8]|uniref:alpha/beta fold hydrolase n=1 Tax=Sinorhizobium sp. BG8 TaxID=2613773 RepID=UPI00193CA4DC|nr:alpha/beta hydrolase [Sinorhizobium sp. BG8]QRM56016.1 alpha/beta hydrolase [Sinorhizobium sp. BG8]
MTDVIPPIRHVRTSMLDLAYEEHGPAEGEAVVLLHGFPYDPRCYDGVAPGLATQGYRVIVPYLRGYGQTRFVSANLMRSGQQAALARDLVDLLDALSIRRAALAGYDWGGRAACIVAAIWPERVRCLVTGCGYNVQDIPGSTVPLAPEAEHRFWYQYYFHSPRGREGLSANRRELCQLLWRLWSPTWSFDSLTFARSAASFDNPDFVNVVVHSYRHRFGYADGDPHLDDIETMLEAQPRIRVPTIALFGADDGVDPPSISDDHGEQFAGTYERRILPGIGHNIPQEAPDAMVQALLNLLRGN